MHYINLSDGGFNWKKINDKNEIGNRPFYYSDLRVDLKMKIGFTVFSPMYM